MREIRPMELTIKPVDLWMNQWLSLTAGTPKDCNMMTVSWGSIGCLWGRPFVQIVVRPQRHTWGYTEKSDSFTVCAFPPEYRVDLQILGTLSGRDGDKLAKTKLTLRPSKAVSSPAYNGASMIPECRKIYRQNLDPECFSVPEIHGAYPEKDYHATYFGEILAAFVV